MTHENDANPEETQEWLDALHAVIKEEGVERAHYLIGRLSNDTARDTGFLQWGDADPV